MLGQGGLVGKEPLPIAVEPRMVTLESRQVVAVLGGDLRGDVFLRAHGVDGHHRSPEIQQAQQLGDGGDLVDAFALRP